MRGRTGRGIRQLLFSLLLMLAGSVYAGPVRVFLVAGQSNANGSGTDAAALAAAPEDAEILFYYRTGAPPADGTDASSGGAWTHLQAQTDNPGNGNFLNPNGGFGPEIGIGRELYSNLDTPLAVIKIAYNGTYLYSDWNAVDPAGFRLFPVLLAETRTALQALRDLGHEPWLSGIFWMQGESDAKSAATASPAPPQPQTADAYPAHLRALVSALRAEWGSERIPVVIGRLAAIDTTNPPGSSFRYWDSIRAGQEAVAGRDWMGAWVDTDDLTKSDWLHYDSAGMLTLGQRMAQAWLEAIHKPARNGRFAAIEVLPEAGETTGPLLRVTLERPVGVSGWTYQAEGSADLGAWDDPVGTSDILPATEPGWEILRLLADDPLEPGTFRAFRWRISIP